MEEGTDKPVGGKNKTFHLGGETATSSLQYQAVMIWYLIKFFYQNFLNEMKWKESEAEDLKEY